MTAPTLMALHAQQIERYGGAHGVRFMTDVLSITEGVVDRWRHEAFQDTAALAATYLVGLARGRGFYDANERTALACALVFLSLNGMHVSVPPDELYALTMRAAKSQTSETAAAAYFRARAERRT